MVEKQTEERQYDRHGNLLVKRVLGDENEDIKYDKFSLYNMTSSYLKKLPPTEKKEQIRAMIKLRQLIADKKSLEKVPTLEMIHKAMEMKQLLNMADEKFTKIYQEPYFMDTGYMPYALQKGVFSEWDIKNKPTYGNDNIANTTVYSKGNSRGVLKSVADNNGMGILCPCDKLNIITAHKTESSTHDRKELGSMRKIELVFTRVLVERQTQEKWPDIREAIACHELDSDQIYNIQRNNISGSQLQPKTRISANYHPSPTNHCK